MKIKKYEKQIADKIINKLTHDDKFFTHGRRNNDAVDIAIAEWIKECYNDEQSYDTFHDAMNVYALITYDSTQFKRRTNTVYHYLNSWQYDLLSYLTRDVDYYMV